MLSALLLVSSSSAHVSLVPNSGAASGGYFQTSIKIPHGHKNAQGGGMHTTKMVLHVPKGILSIRPEPPVGWTVESTMYDLAEEDRYTSHGNLVTTGVDKITFTADSLDDALHNDHLMLIGLQLKIGCSFRDQVTPRHQERGERPEGSPGEAGGRQQHAQHRGGRPRARGHGARRHLAPLRLPRLQQEAGRTHAPFEPWAAPRPLATPPWPRRPPG